MKKNLFIIILFLIEALNLSALANTSVEYSDSVFNGKIDIVYVFEVNDDIFNYGAFIRCEKVVSVSPLYIEVNNK